MRYKLLWSVITIEETSWYTFCCTSFLTKEFGMGAIVVCGERVPPPHTVAYERLKIFRHKIKCYKRVCLLARHWPNWWGKEWGWPSPLEMRITGVIGSWIPSIQCWFQSIAFMMFGNVGLEVPLYISLLCSGVWKQMYCVRKVMIPSLNSFARAGKLLPYLLTLPESCQPNTWGWRALGHHQVGALSENTLPSSYAARSPHHIL